MSQFRHPQRFSKVERRFKRPASPIRSCGEPRRFTMKVQSARTTKTYSAANLKSGAGPQKFVVHCSISHCDRQTDRNPTRPAAMVAHCYRRSLSVSTLKIESLHLTRQAILPNEKYLFILGWISAFFLLGKGRFGSGLVLLFLIPARGTEKRVFSVPGKDNRT